MVTTDQARGTGSTRKLGVALVAALCLCLLISGGASAATRAPSGLAFYNPPAHLIAGKPGTVIWSRTVHTPSGLPAAGRTTLVLYRSVLPNGKSTPVSGLIFTPRGKAPKHGWKLISWAHGTTGIADICAPSRDVSNPYAAYMYPDFNQWLKSGYVVAQTDYQGLGTPGTHLYLIGHPEGAAVDNIVLAARHLDPAVGRKFAIAGHSQGGQAALFAAAEAGRDDPGLTLVGVAAFAPASHITTEFKAAGSLTSPGGGLSGIGALIVTSAAADSPAVHLNALLTPAAQQLLPEVKTECLGALSKPNSWGGLAPAKLLTGADRTALYKVLDGMNPALVIRSPVQILQGVDDQTVYPALTDLLDGELVAKGDKVDYRKFPGTTHSTVVINAFTTATKFLAKHFG